MSVSSRLDLDNVLSKNDETRNDEVFEEGHFPALKRNYDQRKHARHIVTGHTASRNSFPEYRSGRFQTQKSQYRNNPLNRKTRQHTLHLITQCQWLNIHHKDEIQFQATLLTTLLK